MAAARQVHRADRPPAVMVGPLGAACSGGGSCTTFGVASHVITLMIEIASISDVSRKSSGSAIATIRARSCAPPGGIERAKGAPFLKEGGGFMCTSIRRAMGILTSAAALVVVVPCGAQNSWAQEQGKELRQQIVGAWSLAEQWVEQDGKKTQRFGANPKGISIYEVNGRFASILLRPDLPRIASNNVMTGTVDENKAIVQGSTAIYGRWSVNEQDGSVSAKIDGSTYPNWDGLDQKRTVSISGDEMKLCVPGAQIGGTACAVWKRVK